MKNKNTHATLLVLVGGDILYIAYMLFDKMRSGAQEMPPALNIAAIAFFALAGLGVLLYAWKTWRKDDKADKEGPEQEDQIK